MTIVIDGTPQAGEPQQYTAGLTHRLVLIGIMSFTGAAGLIFEYVLGTINSYLVGNSIMQMTLTIGIMFGMMGVGGFLQKFITKGLVEFFLVAELMIVILGGFSPIVMQWVFANFQESYEPFKWIYICVLGLLIGIEIPIVMRINEPFSSDLGKNIAGTWAWDYIGGAFGVVLWVVLLKLFVPLTHISFIVAALNLVVAIMALVYFWNKGLLRWRLTPWVGTPMSILVVVAVAIGWTSVDNWSTAISQKLYEDPIVFQASTPYQQIVMTKGQHPGDPYGANFELFLNGNKQFSSVDEAIYHEMLVHPAMNAAASRKNVLVLGGGDGLATREILKYPDVKNVTLVDLDPAMTEMARTNEILTELNQGAFDDARVHAQASEGVTPGELVDVIVQTDEPASTSCDDVDHGGMRQPSCVTTMKTENLGQVNIFNIDADRFVSDASGPWDVVIIDLPDPNSIELAKLYSFEFYKKVQRNMAHDAVVVVQSTSPYHAKETYLCILRTLSAAGFGVVPYHVNVPSFGDWGWVIGSPSLDGNDLRERLESIESFGVETAKIDPQVLDASLVFNKGDLKSSNSTISTLMEPTVFQYYEYEGWKVE